MEERKEYFLRRVHGAPDVYATVLGVRDVMHNGAVCPQVVYEDTAGRHYVNEGSTLHRVRQNPISGRWTRND